MSYYEPYDFFGPDTSALDAAIAHNGGFFLETPVLDAMIDANGGFLGPDTSWIQAEMDANFDASNPYLFDAMQSTLPAWDNATTNANDAWSDYITS